MAVAQQDASPRPTPDAPRGGTWELSIGPGGTLLDRQLIAQVRRTDTSASRIAPGVAVRLGRNFGRSWSLGAGAALGFTTPATIFQPFAELGWTPNVNWRTSPFLTLGTGTTYVRWRSYHGSGRYGVHIGGGIRQALSEKVALRLEVREQYEKHEDATRFPDPVFNGIASLSLSFFLGGGPVRDSDGDGVRDGADRCPDTPADAVVDASGCPSDGDGDGVPDGLDRCPDTPAGAEVGATGCPPDRDGDGVADNLDRCPNTPAGALVDANGCPRDGDGDGVADYLDRCADTPADGRLVDANGCPVDSDNDGVWDGLDQCPNTAPDARPVHPIGNPRAGCPVDSDNDGVADNADRCPDTPASTRVDGAGCPFRELPAAGATSVIRGINFASARSDLLPTSYAELDRIAAAMLAIPGSQWEVSGHTDNRGAAAANLRLSVARARAVVANLVSRGVPAASLVSAGYGSRRPVAPNTTAAGRAQNRRIEIKRLR